MDAGGIIDSSRNLTGLWKESPSDDDDADVTFGVNISDQKPAKIRAKYRTIVTLLNSIEETSSDAKINSERMNYRDRRIEEQTDSNCENNCSVEVQLHEGDIPRSGKGAQDSRRTFETRSNDVQNLTAAEQTRLSDSASNRGTKTAMTVGDHSSAPGRFKTNTKENLRFEKRLGNDREELGRFSNITNGATSVRTNWKNPTSDPLLPASLLKRRSQSLDANRWKVEAALSWPNGETHDRKQPLITNSCANNTERRRDRESDKLTDKYSNLPKRLSELRVSANRLEAESDCESCGDSVARRSPNSGVSFTFVGDDIADDLCDLDRILLSSINPGAEEETPIVSCKGTVRGFKNRVKVGVAVFDDTEDPTSKVYRVLERGKVVLYTTSVSVVRETHERCLAIQKILQNHMVKFEERDISLSRDFQRQLVDRLGTEHFELPQIFVSGINLGGPEAIDRLNETGVLRKIFRNVKKVSRASHACVKCGGYNFVLCGSCRGSKKSSRRNNFTEQSGALRCVACDDNGLVRCNLCCDTKALEFQKELDKVQR